MNRSLSRLTRKNNLIISYRQSKKQSENNDCVCDDLLMIWGIFIGVGFGKGL